MPSIHSLRAVLLASAVAAAAPAIAAEVTPARLANPEPGNWLTNHRTYDSQRFSPLDQMNKATIKNLKLAYAVAIGGNAVNENLELTPLAEDGFLYVVNLWGVVYKIDARSATSAASCGAWTRGRRRRRTPIVAWRCGEILSSRSRTTRRGSSQRTKKPARLPGRPTYPTVRMACSSRRRRSP